MAREGGRGQTEGQASGTEPQICPRHDCEVEDVPATILQAPLWPLPKGFRRKIGTIRGMSFAEASQQKEPQDKDPSDLRDTGQIHLSLATEASRRPSVDLVEQPRSDGASGAFSPQTRAMGTTLNPEIQLLKPMHLRNVHCSLVQTFKVGIQQDETKILAPRCVQDKIPECYLTRCRCVSSAYSECPRSR